MKKMFKYVSKKGKEKIKLFSDENVLIKPRIEMFSNKEITIEGCGGVLEFCDSFVKLKFNLGYMTVCGKMLDISQFEEEQITIKGEIENMEFVVSEESYV